MNKRTKIIYWIFTLWMALGMTSIGIVQIMHAEAEVARMTRLGFPVYILTFLGVCKLIGVVAVLTPRFPVVKEWAYAGFFFTIAGALFSHVAVHDPLSEFIPAFLLLVLTFISWYVRPADRKITLTPTV